LPIVRCCHARNLVPWQGTQPPLPPSARPPRTEARSTSQTLAAANSGIGYQRYRPGQSLLYQIIERYYPAFLAHLSSVGRTLPRYVEREFEEYLKRSRLEYGFLRVRCSACHAEKLWALLCQKMTRGVASLLIRWPQLTTE
jgi:hypothetical protein